MRTGKDDTKTRLLLALIVVIVHGAAASVRAQEDSGLKTVRQLWQTPTPDYRMKTWWFFGYEQTTDEGITADAESLRDAGFGGVVYYDQNHAKDAAANGAEDAFSESWWHHLQFAAQEARRCGLSFEVNISNGYCAGGRWIDPRHAMQRVAASEAVVTVVEGGGVQIDGSLDISGPDGYVCDIATLAMPLFDDGKKRYVTARYVAQGKGRNGAMQRPTDRTASADEFSGYGFVTLPDVGVLQASNDSIAWRDIVPLDPMYNSQGGYRIRTTAFEPTEGRYWRVRYTEGSRPLSWWYVGCEPKMDRWEERAALQSDFAEAELTPKSYNRQGVIVPSQVRPIADGLFTLELSPTLSVFFVVGE